jgi:RNA 2',3'-cyclic 3'-phosphodiesterase
VRIFVALDIPEEVRAALDALITRLRPVSRAVRWTRIEGVHLTLKFIGEVQPEKVEAIEASLSQIRFPHPIEMKFRGAGFFPNERRPSVFWAGVEVGAELGALASAVETSLLPLGIAKDHRAFSPHLTLARFKSTDGSALNRLHEAISAAGPLEFGAGIAKDFHLYQSILKPGGAEYTRLATFLFAGGESQ